MDEVVDHWEFDDSVSPEMRSALERMTSDPFKSEDAKVGGSIENLDPALQEPQTGSQSLTEDLEQLWAEVRTAPLLEQIADIAASAVKLSDHLAIYKMLEREDESAFGELSITLDLDGREKQIVSLGVNIVGVLFPHLAPLAAQLHAKTVEATNANAKRMEESGRSEEIRKSVQRGAKRELAEAYGLTLEEYNAKCDEALDADGGTWSEE